MTQQKVRPHKVLQKRGGSLTEALMLTEGKHRGIIFSYGKVKLNEETVGDELRLQLKYDYEVHDDGGVFYKKEELEQELGDFLVELIGSQIEDNEVVFTGGVDEIRENDNKQFNP